MGVAYNLAIRKRGKGIKGLWNIKITPKKN